MTFTQSVPLNSEITFSVKTRFLSLPWLTHYHGYFIPNDSQPSYSTSRMNNSARNSTRSFTDPNQNSIDSLIIGPRLALLSSLWFICVVWKDCKIKKAFKKLFVYFVNSLHQVKVMETVQFYLVLLPFC